MEKWSDKIFDQLEEKRSSIPKNDFRFLSIGRITLMAQKTEEFAESCPACQNNRQIIGEMIQSLPECLNSPGGRKSYEKKKNLIESHLSKVHHIRPAHYLYAFYTLLGLLAGFLAGLLLSFTVGKTWDRSFLLSGSTLGLLLGQAYGKYADKRNYKKNLQI
ncbi:MAG: hypothetical protein JW801_01545 [Bacteroidales bacterium]|nr:hypothetical protein [Bacteroidales bacterium]